MESPEIGASADLSELGLGGGGEKSGGLGLGLRISAKDFGFRDGACKVFGIGHTVSDKLPLTLNLKS